MGFYVELINKDQEKSFPFFVKQLLIAYSNVLFGRMINIFHTSGVYSSSLNYLVSESFCSSLNKF